MVDLVLERFQTGREQDIDREMRDLIDLARQLEAIITELQARIQVLEDA